ncbi:ABC transporter permease subunit [bacterium]|nr:ABC transporter permease subunit [bacterium]
MFAILIQKELKHILLGPKFISTFLICTVLILLSTFIGVQDYKAAQSSYDAGTGLTNQRLSEKTSWSHMSSTVYRRPDPMRIFSIGISNDLGRFSPLSEGEAIRLDHSVYSDNPIYAVFRFLDLGFIFQVVLSLFAILFTFNAINGEREMGTLKLTLSNDVPRAQYVLAKFAGSWLSLIVPLFIPLLISMLMIIAMGVPLAAVHWVKIGSFMGLSILYLTFFIATGIMVSGMTRNSSGSFLILLIFWVSSVLIVPRVGMMLAAKIQPAPSIAEVDAQIDEYSKDRWNEYIADIEEGFAVRQAATEGMTDEEAQAYRDDNEWDWMEQGEKERLAMQTDIQNYRERLMENLNGQKHKQEVLAMGLSRLSPASAYMHAAMQISGTHSDMKDRYESAIREYRTQFMNYTEEMKKKTGMDNINGFSIAISSDGTAEMSIPKDQKPIDASSIPQFIDPEQDFSDVFNRSTIDIALLLIFTAAVLIAAYATFMRYDVR